MRRALLFLLTVMLLTPNLTVSRATAQEADAPAPVTVVAGGLINPRGFTWDTAGAIVVAEAGTGGETVADEVPPPTGPYHGGPTARVSRIEAGCPVTVAGGLPSAVSASGEPIGAADVALVGDRQIVLLAGGGAAHGNPDQPAGVYELNDGEIKLIADLSGFFRTDSVSEPPPVGDDPDGFLYSMLVNPEGNAVWIVDRDDEQVLSVDLAAGAIVRLADLSAEDALPTALAVDSAGALHVGLFSSEPYAEGNAYVLKVAGDGQTEKVWTGLTMVTGLAFGPDGTLYATEFSSARDQPPFVVAGSGRVVRQTGPDSSEEVLTQLNLPTTTRFGPDGALYVSLPGVGADNGSGIVIRADISGGAPLEAQAYDLSAAACLPGGGEGAIRISIVDFGFDPSTLTITEGTTVTWVNDGAVDHTTVSFEGGGKTWDSNILAPGAEYSVTFGEVGTYEYVCGLHPEMKGTIEVVPTGP